MVEKSSFLFGIRSPKYVKSDVRSITGSNVRNILLLTEKDDFEDVTKHDIKKLKYHEISSNDSWKTSFIKEIIEIKNNQLDLNEFTKEELNDILAHLCIE